MTVRGSRAKQLTSDRLAVDETDEWTKPSIESRERYSHLALFGRFIGRKTYWSLCR